MSTTDDEVRPRADVEQEAVRALRSLRSADESRRTDLRVKIANLLVELREHHFTTPEGRPDWTGRTQAYRLAVRDIYSRAGYSKEEALPIQKITQYHMGNIVREKLTDSEREDVGLGETSPRDQGAKTRAERSELVRQARELLGQPAHKGRRR